MKHAHCLPTPNTLQSGHYIFWQQRTYQVVTPDPGNALLLHIQPLGEGPRIQLSLLDLLSIPRTNPSAPLFAPTLEALHQQIEEQEFDPSEKRDASLSLDYLSKLLMDMDLDQTP
jgi:hypothetical protein